MIVVILGVPMDRSNTAMNNSTKSWVADVLQICLPVEVVHDLPPGSPERSGRDERDASVSTKSEGQSQIS